MFRQQEREESGTRSADAIDPSTLPVCEVPQQAPVVLPGDTCKGNESPVWCYVESSIGRKPAGPNCAQAIILSSGTASLVGARFKHQCIASGEPAMDSP